MLHYLEPTYMGRIGLAFSLSCAAVGVTAIGIGAWHIVRETRVLRRTRPSNPHLLIVAAESSPDRLSPETRRRLARAATDAFLEYLGARNATSITFGGGPFEILITPVEGGFTVSGLVDGPLEVTP